MGIFSNRRTSSNEVEAFPRTIIHEFLVLRSWPKGIFVVHMESSGTNSIYLNLLGRTSDWTSISVNSRKNGQAEMRKLEANPEYIKSLFKEADFKGVDFTVRTWNSELRAYNQPQPRAWYLKAGISEIADEHGFEGIVRLNESDPENPIDQDIDVLSHGNMLVDQLNKQNYLPKSKEEVAFFRRYLLSDHMKIGLFGNFKYVLKRLTDLFDEVAQQGNDEVTLALAACLGFGYGQVEGYVSRGVVSPRSYLQQRERELLSLSQLPAFGNRSYPSLRTAQYLSRLGLRFLRRIEKDYEPKYSTFFKLYCLAMADFFDQRSEDFPEYQLLVNHIIFGNSKLNQRGNSGRKLAVTEKFDRDNFSTPPETLKALGQEELERIATWIEVSLEGNNPLIAHHALDLTIQLNNLYSDLNIEFPWNKKLIGLLGQSQSPRVQNAVVQALTKDVSQFIHLSLTSQVKILKLLSPEVINKILSLQNFPMRYLAYQWAAECSTGELSEHDLAVSKIFLQRRFLNQPNDELFSFIVNVAKFSQLEPFEEWKPLLDLRLHLVNVWSDWQTSRNLEMFFRYLGLKNDVQGIFDVLKSPSESQIEFFASLLAREVSPGKEETTSLTLNSLLDSATPALQSIALLILRKRLIPEENIRAFLAQRNDPDLALLLLKSAVQADDKQSVLLQLANLGDETERVFWRKNGSDVEKIFQSWKGFPGFFWSEADKFPEFIVETVTRYSWLTEGIFSLITPGSIAKMTSLQSEIFQKLLDKDQSLLKSDSILRAVLVAPDAKINEFGARYVKTTNRYADFWLLMLESNLPITTKAANEYLKSQAQSSDFASKIIMALDSNNKNARINALRIVSESATPKILESLIAKLVENKNSDVWALVRQNLSHVKEHSSIKTFTKRVFLSRRQARLEKEKIKSQLSEVVGNISEAVESDVLLRMTFSSVAKDREWALKQVALGQLSSDEVLVEQAWRGPANV